MLPSEFKAFKALVELFRSNLSAIHEAINKQTNAAIQEHTADRKEVQSAAGTLRSISDEIQAGNQQTNTSSDQASGQQERLIAAQNRLVLWAAFAFFAAFGYGAVAFWQGILMHRTYKEMQSQTKAARQSAYMSCLSAQAAQVTLLQIQKSASDSHSVAVATVEQTTANMAAERAIVHLIPRFPAKENSIESHLAIPYVIKNDGKSAALTADIWIKAILLNEKDALHITGQNLENIHGKYVPSGDQFPEAPANPQFRPITVSIVVRDSKERIVSDVSPEAKAFLNDYRGIAFVYGHMSYADFFGTHKARFCLAVYAIKGGATHYFTKAERTCAIYNHQEDQYAQVPNVGKFLPDTSRIEPIKCFVPAD